MEPMGILQGFLGWLVQASVQASLLVVLILALQAVLKNRLPAGWRHALWLLLLVRLALPWAPTSSLSVFNLFSGLEPRPAVVAMAQAPAQERPGLEGAGQGGQAVHVAKPVPRMNLKPLLGIAWLLGIAAFAGAIFAQYMMLWTAVRNRRPVTDAGTLALLERCKAAMGVTGCVSIVEVPGATGPALLGFWRPRLLLPAGAIQALGAEQLRHVFMHELAHLKRRDVAINWAMAVLQALHWFNPLIWFAFSRMRSDRELACDALVLARLSPDEKTEYGNTIIHLLEHFSRPQLLPGLAGILEDQEQMKRRITMIAQFKRRSWAWSAAGVMVMLMVACTTLTNALRHEKGVPGTGSVDRPREYAADPAVVGAWESVDFVEKIENFDPARTSFKGDLFLTGVTFTEGGATDGPWTWTKGYMWHPGDQTEAQYTIKKIGAEDYLFMEWMSGDVTIRHMAPWYYVMKRSNKQPAALTDAQRETIERAAQSSTYPTPEMVAQIEIGKSGREDAVKAFGAPLQYIWGQGPFKTFTVDKLPKRYCMTYPRHFMVVVIDGVILEIRHHEPGFMLREKLQVGSSLEEVVGVLGEPTKTVEGKNGLKDGVLYKDIDGLKGWCYYARPDQGVRMFFSNYKVNALYQTAKK